MIDDPGFSPTKDDGKSSVARAENAEFNYGMAALRALMRLRLIQTMPWPRRSVGWYSQNTLLEIR